MSRLYEFFHVQLLQSIWGAPLVIGAKLAGEVKNIGRPLPDYKSTHSREYHHTGWIPHMLHTKGAYLTARKPTTIATCCLFHCSEQVWLYPVRILACLSELLNSAPWTIFYLPNPWMESPGYPWQAILTVGKLFPLKSNGPIWDGHGVWLREKFYHYRTQQFHAVLICMYWKLKHSWTPQASRSVDLCVLKVVFLLTWELGNY